jgi:hypothetical protein
MSLLRQQRRNVQTTKIMTQYDYDILRTNGVPLGKRDFMGRLNLKS